MGYKPLAEFLANRRKELNKNLPKSEWWFFQKYKQNMDIHDEFNSPFMGKIPDIINHKYKYIIEIDGSIHETEAQKKKDIEKDKLFKTGGYSVFRVIHDNEKSFYRTLRAIKKLRNKYNKRERTPIKKLTCVKLKKRSNRKYWIRC